MAIKFKIFTYFYVQDVKVKFFICVAKIGC